MRGSPLLRTLIVLAALLVTGLALGRLTRGHAATVVTEPEKVEEKPTAAKKKATYDLVLSGTAKEVAINEAAVAVAGTGPLAGSLELGDGEPVIALRVLWADQAAAGHRFAKLRLEIPGKPTLEHVFDSSGDIDDIWEP